MISGYVCAIVIIIVSILWVTGWRETIAPNVSTREVLFCAGLLALAAMPLPLWFSPLPSMPDVQLHASASLLLLGGLFVISRKGFEGYRSYIGSCAIMVGMVWGSVRGLYAHETMFYVFHPDWDAPLLGGLLCGAFASERKQQFVIVTWGGALSAVVQRLLEGSGLASIGAWPWWDGVAAALSAAVTFTIVSRAIRRCLVKLGAAGWLGWLRQLKGDKSS
ncbi:hypothetical protein [Paenibacillus sp. PL2-23]|uniref:hypothetical protein n=1 Tax=Paenibacillus sp. PL2-23 TaxID=2100729 RepID=UPI0030F5D2D7